MRTQMTWAFAVSLAFTAVCTAFAQSAHPGVQPFTAELRGTNVQTLADGTTITRQTKLLKARDAQGRILTQTSNIIGPDGQTGKFLFGNVIDYSTDTTTIWLSQTHQATIRQGPPRGQEQGCWADDAGGIMYNFSGKLQPYQQHPQNVAKPTEENLGTKTINGVLVVGLRRTWVTPTGAEGNSAPLVKTEETWTAPSLGGLTLSLVLDDPQNGKQTTELVSLTLGDPDPSLFQPPADYQIVTMTAHQVPCPQ